MMIDRSINEQPDDSRLIPASFVEMYNELGSMIRLSADDEPLIAGAVRRWLASVKRADELLVLTTLGGATFCTLVSDIRSWSITTRECRDRAAEQSAALDAEQSQNAKPDWME